MIVLFLLAHSKARKRFHNTVVYRNIRNVTCEQDDSLETPVVETICFIMKYLPKLGEIMDVTEVGCRGKKSKCTCQELNKWGICTKLI